jgi:hypothetical protein
MPYSNQSLTEVSNVRQFEGITKKHQDELSAQNLRQTIENKNKKQ